MVIGRGCGPENGNLDSGVSGFVREDVRLPGTGCVGGLAKREFERADNLNPAGLRAERIELAK